MRGVLSIAVCLSAVVAMTGCGPAIRTQTIEYRVQQTPKVSLDGAKTYAIVAPGHLANTPLVDVEIPGLQRVGNPEQADVICDISGDLPQDDRIRIEEIAGRVVTTRRDAKGYPLFVDPQCKYRPEQKYREPIYPFVVYYGRFDLRQTLNMQLKDRRSGGKVLGSHDLSMARQTFEVGKYPQRVVVNKGDIGDAIMSPLPDGAWQDDESTERLVRSMQEEYYIDIRGIDGKSKIQDDLPRRKDMESSNLLRKGRDNAQVILRDDYGTFERHGSAELAWIEEDADLTVAKDRYAADPMEAIKIWEKVWNATAALPETRLCAAYNMATVYLARDELQSSQEWATRAAELNRTLNNQFMDSKIGTVFTTGRNRLKRQ